MDDLLVESPDVDCHIQHLTLLFRILSDNRIVVILDKLELDKTEMMFLGQEITRRGIKTSKDKERESIDYAAPSSIKELTAIVNFCRH